jgi:hypothetical protein
LRTSPCLVNHTPAINQWANCWILIASSVFSQIRRLSANEPGIDLRKLRRDARKGAVSVEELLDVLDKLEQAIQGLRRDNARLQERLAAYEKDSSEAEPSTDQPPQSYSLGAKNAGDSGADVVANVAKSRRGARPLAVASPRLGVEACRPWAWRHISTP